MKNVVFIVDNLSLPRCIKRINAFIEQGMKVKVYGYDRGSSHGNQFPPEIPVVILRHLNDGRDYFSKLKAIRHDVKKVLSENSDDNSVIYAFGFISSFMLALQGGKFVYEISDVRYASYKKFAPFIALLKQIDKWIINKSIATVMTSGGFKDFFDSKKKEIFVIPNKVNNYWADYERRRILTIDSGIRFAFVGLIRYASIFKFAKVIGDQFPNHSFDFYGAPSKEINQEMIDLLKDYKNVRFNGKFKNPEDLSEIYKKVDVVVSCYDIKTLNERIAEPNKLYESIFFCRPILVSQDIYLAKQVEHYGCGYAIDASNEESISRFVQHISFDDLKDISEREYNIPSSELIDSTKNIIDYIKGITL